MELYQYIVFEDMACQTLWVCLLLLSKLRHKTAFRSPFFVQSHGVCSWRFFAFHFKEESLYDGR